MSELCENLSALPYPQTATIKSKDGGGSGGFGGGGGGVRTETLHPDRTDHGVLLTALPFPGQPTRDWQEA